MLFSVGMENRTASAAILVRVNSPSLPSVFSGHTTSPDQAFQRPTALLHRISTWFMSLSQCHTKSRSRGVPMKLLPALGGTEGLRQNLQFFFWSIHPNKTFASPPPFPTGDHWSPVRVKKLLEFCIIPNQLFQCPQLVIFAWIYNITTVLIDLLPIFQTTFKSSNPLLDF